MTTTLLIITIILLGGLYYRLRSNEESEKGNMERTIELLSAKALKDNRKDFLDSASNVLDPIEYLLKEQGVYVKNLNDTSSNNYANIDAQINSLRRQNQELQQETSLLRNTLSGKTTKGCWGETSLKRVVELSGLSEHVDFSSQETLDNRQRPDMIVKLPGDRFLAIDAKTNTAGFMDAVDEQDEKSKSIAMDRFVKEVRTSIKSLSAKKYWAQFKPSPQFVVLFMPGESFFAGALSHDPELIEFGIKSGVLLASPITLMSLLVSIRHGWQQQTIAENAEKIAGVATELHDRIKKMFDTLQVSGKELSKFVAHFNSCTTLCTKQVLPSCRKLEKLGINVCSPIEAPAEVETEVKEG